MHRFYALKTDLSVHLAYLSPEDAVHAFRVLRLHPGDEIEILDQGNRDRASLLEEKNGLYPVRLLSDLPSTEPKLRITLFQGLPKNDKMDLIVQKSTELGAARIIPVMMERCVSRPDEKGSESRLQRWRKIAREAGKQSGRTIMPEIGEIKNLKDIPEIIQTLDACVVPWENALSFGPLSFSKSFPSLTSLGIVIGPEGGISDDEIELLRNAGCIPITLGPRILRTETAGIASIAVFHALFGEME